MLVLGRALSLEEVQAIYQRGLILGNYEKTRQKLLIGPSDYYFRLLDPDVEPAAVIRNSEGKAIAAGAAPIEGVLQAVVRRPVVFSYQKLGETEPKQHPAIAELTLYLQQRTW